MLGFSKSDIPSPLLPSPVTPFNAWPSGSAQLSDSATRLQWLREAGVRSIGGLVPSLSRGSPALQRGDVGRKTAPRLLKGLFV